jgi:TATA-box binding protein (TBP) (component of TFIID and TFIIIB)
MQVLEQVSKLASQIEEMKMTVLSHEKLINENKAKVTYASRLNKPRTYENQKKQTNFNANKNSYNENKSAPEVNKNTSNKNSNQNINKNDDNNEKLIENSEDNDSDFTPVVRKGKVNKKVKVFGTGGTSSTCTLTAVTKMAHLHVWRLSKDTTDVALRDYLKSALDTENVIVESLKTKGDYASFKVSVNFDLMDKIYEPEIWPKNTAVSRFKFLTKFNKSE